MTDAAPQRRQALRELFATIEQLKSMEAEQLARRILQMQAQCKVPHLSTNEAELLQEIYRKNAWHCKRALTNCKFCSAIRP